MKTFKQYIEEAFDKPYPYKLKYVASRDEYNSIVTLKDKTKLIVKIVKQIEPRKEYWEVDFMRGGSMGLSGEGDQMRVFATVISMIKEFVKREKPEEIRFGAEKTPDEDRKDVTGSREKLYSRMTKKFANEMGYDSKERKESYMTKYILTKR